MTQDAASPAGTPAQPAPTIAGRPTFAVPESAAVHVTEVARIVAAELVLAESRDAKASLQHEVSEVDERLRGDELAAARGYLAAFNTRPAFRPPLDALIRLYARRRSVPNLAKLYDALIKAASTDRDRAGAVALRAELLEDRLNDRPGAREALERAVTLDPSCRVAWLGLERFALRDGDGPLLVRTLSQLAAVTLDPNRRARLLTELAAELAREGTPAALDEASRHLREAAALPQGRSRALTELQRFAERTGRPEDQVFALEGCAVLAEGVARGDASEGGSGAFAIQRLDGADAARAEAAALWLRAARLRLSALGDHDGARESADRCLALAPDEARHRYAVMILADQAHEIERASVQAAWLLEHGFGDPYLRASLQFRIAETAAMRGDLGGAAEALRAALLLNPESAAARGALVEQLVATGDGPAVVQEFEALAEAAADGSTRAALHRAGALYALALHRNMASAIHLLRRACEDDPADTVARRALVALLARRPPGSASEDPAALVSAINALLPHVADDDERTALLLQRFYAERFGQGDTRAAALTAEQLVEASDEAPWALESAALLWAATGEMAHAARWAQALADLGGAETDIRGWRAAAARWTWAAGDAPRALDLATTAHRQHPSDGYLSALAFRLALAGQDHALALDIATRTADALSPRSGARWLLVAEECLLGVGAAEPARIALESAVARAPAEPAVRAAALARSRWRGDVAMRAALTDAALDAADAGPEEVALGLELALVRAFVDHDVPAAGAVIERVAARDGAISPAAALLHAISRGAREGPDAPATVNALQEVLQALPSSDPLRLGVELEVARALGASSATRDQAAAARDLVNEDQPHLAAPRLLALLDAIEREGREDVPAALGRVADLGDPATAEGLRGAAVSALRALGRAVDARALALKYPELPASVTALSESLAGMDRAGEYADALGRRAVLATGHGRMQVAQAAASWASIAGRDADALTRAGALLQVAPDGVLALDVKRVASRRMGDLAAVADACEALALRVKSPTRAAGFWEEAGVVSAEALADLRRAERCLRAALKASPARPLAYRVLREILEGRRDTAALESLVTRRVEVVSADSERAELLWEQARLRRALGRREEALESATRVVALAPDNVAALALVAEVHASSGRLAETADALAAFAACRETPATQRRAARQGALDLFDQRLRKPARAIEQVEALLTEGDADDALIERGVAIATRAELWDAALRFMRRAVERAPEGPARAVAMLGVAHLHRDRLRDPAAARENALAAHEAFPGDLEVLRTLQGLSDPDDRPRFARATVEALRETARTTAVTASLALSLAEAARSGGDGVLERASLRLARALGDTSAPVLPPLGLPAGASLRDPALVLRYRNPVDSGRAVTILETVLPDLATLAGLSTDALGVGRGDRQRGQGGARTAVAPFAAATGYAEFELYVGGPDARRIAVIPGDPPSVILGRAVDLSLDEAARFELVRMLLLAARGVAPLAVQSVETVASEVMAALAYAELPLAGGTARFDALLRPVAKAVSRRVRRTVAESGRAVAVDPDGWGEVCRAARGVLSTARRGAMAVTGAVGPAFRDVARTEGLGDGSPAALVASAAPARDLGLFALSDALAQIARETGVDRR